MAPDPDAMGTRIAVVFIVCRRFGSPEGASAVRVRACGVLGAPVVLIIVVIKLVGALLVWCGYSYLTGVGLKYTWLATCWAVFTNMWACGPRPGRHGHTHCVFAVVFIACRPFGSPELALMECNGTDRRRR
jgi:hypothetical protein